MKRPSVVAYVLAVFFALGILCSTLAAPGRVLASVSPCSQTLGEMAMKGCEHPDYLWGFDPTSSLLSYGALSSARSSDSTKDILRLSLPAFALDVFMGLAPPGMRQRNNGPLAKAYKISIRLFNSRLNL